MLSCHSGIHKVSSQEEAILTSQRRPCESAQQAGGRLHCDRFLETKHKPCSTKQYTNNVTLCRVRVTTVAIENKTMRSQCAVGPRVCQQLRNIGSAAFKTQ